MDLKWQSPNSLVGVENTAPIRYWVGDYYNLILATRIHMSHMILLRELSQQPWLGSSQLRE